MLRNHMYKFVAILVKYYADHFFPLYPTLAHTTTPTETQPSFFAPFNKNNIFFTSFQWWILWIL